MEFGSFGTSLILILEVFFFFFPLLARCMSSGSLASLEESNF